VGPDESRQENLFPRVRGSLFHARILNAGSAEAFFAQIQSQAVNTGNRLLTPLIPPPAASSLCLESFKVHNWRTAANELVIVISFFKIESYV
jgi:hypothetical protein